MNTYPVIATAPASEPVDLADARLHLRVDSTDEDALVSACLEAGRQWAEAYARRAFITQTWDLYADAFPADGVIELPSPPLQTVTSVKYYDTANVLQTLAATEYLVTLSERGRVVLATGKSWPATYVRPDAVVVRFVAGYGTSGASVPAGIRQAILLVASELYKNREQSVSGTINPVLVSAERLLDPYRSLRVA